MIARALVSQQTSKQNKKVTISGIDSLFYAAKVRQFGEFTKDFCKKKCVFHKTAS